MTQSKKKKILVITPIYAKTETSTGLGSLVRDLCNTLADQGYMVDVVVPHDKDTKAIERYNNITIYRFHCIPMKLQPYTQEKSADTALTAQKLDYAWLMVYRYSLSLKLKQLMKRYTYESIHAHWLSPQGWVAAKVMEKLEISTPLISTIYERDLNPSSGSGESGARQMAIKASKTIIANSNMAKTQLLKQHPELNSNQVTVLNPGLDLDGLYCRMPYVKRQKHSLLFIGDLVQETGIQYLIPAIALIRKQVPQIQLFIVGEGPYRNKTEELAREYDCFHSLQFVGDLAAPAIALFLNKARMLINPILEPAEPFALSYIEQMNLYCAKAMGCKCPVLSSAIEGTSHLVTDKKTGLLFRPSNSEDIAKKVLWAMDNAQEVKNIVNNATEFVNKHYNITETSKAYLKLFPQLEAPKPQARQQG